MDVREGGERAKKTCVVFLLPSSLPASSQPSFTPSLLYNLILLLPLSNFISINSPSLNNVTVSINLHLRRYFYLRLSRPSFVTLLLILNLRFSQWHRLIPLHCYYLLLLRCRCKPRPLCKLVSDWSVVGYMLLIGRY